MRNLTITSLLMLVLSVGHAQVNKCTVGGRTVYQQEPCAGAEQSGRRTNLGAPLSGTGNTTAGAQLLWPGVEFGMPPSDVLRLVPGSRGDSGSVTLKGFRFAEKTFDVQFSFQSDRLVQIHLGDTVFMEPNAAVRSSFDRLVATLSRTYGEPLSKNVEERGSGLRGEAVWKRPGSEVTVTISAVTKDQSMILFNFFSRK